MEVSVLASSLAFVLGFSVVFISFGASASAVGKFLVSSKSLLAPLAGAVILLFGLHLVGWLSRISIRIGLVIGAVLVALAILLRFRPGLFGSTLDPIHFFSLSLIFLAGPFLTRWLNRDVHFRDLGSRPGHASGFLIGFAFGFGWAPRRRPILLRC